MARVLRRCANQRTKKCWTNKNSFLILAALKSFDAQYIMKPVMEDGRSMVKVQTLLLKESGPKKLVNCLFTKCSCLMQDCTSATDWNMLNFTLSTSMRNLLTTR
ncbi:uncharacterized protein LOC111347371 [Stylophora pistillata]|uniref:uncharacterized protein LOC111347371 n=1 Tax=Stylophora pistillata TaxID=50429 RepID=UPI000C056974|nr:uncharacterized protein LOC111347371 [Stylophora pistillata]